MKASVTTLNDGIYNDEDKYVNGIICTFFEIGGRFGPEIEGRIVEALNIVIDKAYNDGLEDAHQPVHDRCAVCGSFMPEYGKQM